MSAEGHGFCTFVAQRFRAVSAAHLQPEVATSDHRRHRPTARGQRRREDLCYSRILTQQLQRERVHVRRRDNKAAAIDRIACKPRSCA